MRIGTELACKIIALLKLQGIQKVCSGITQPNPKSDGYMPNWAFSWSARTITPDLRPVAGMTSVGFRKTLANINLNRKIPWLYPR